MQRWGERLRKRADRSRLDPLGEEPLEIGPLISPLRYDVLIRAQYMDHVAGALDLFYEDFDEFVRQAESQPYYAWYRECAFPRLQRANPRLELSTAFRNRVLRTTELWRNFECSGFDPRYPISVRTTTGVSRTSSGKALLGRTFPTDGCHRLALLLLAGYTHVPAGHYRIREEADLAPPDNTGTLLRTLPMARDEYYRFLSQGYASSPLTDRLALLDHVRQQDAARVPELEQILAADERYLPAASVAS